jgi:hypothetical protein
MKIVDIDRLPFGQAGSSLGFSIVQDFARYPEIYPETGFSLGFIFPCLLTYIGCNVGVSSSLILKVQDACLVCVCSTALPLGSCPRNPLITTSVILSEFKTAPLELLGFHFGKSWGFSQSWGL